MSAQFFETIMGKRFIEGTMPSIMRSLDRIADALEKMNEPKDVTTCDNAVEVEWSLTSKGVTTTGETRAQWNIESLVKIVDEQHGSFSDWSIDAIPRTYADGYRTFSITFERGYTYMIFTVKR